MKKLNKQFINVERSKNLVLLLTYMTCPYMLISSKDLMLIEKHIKEIIKIYERNCD